LSRCSGRRMGHAIDRLQECAAPVADF